MIISLPLTLINLIIASPAAVESFVHHSTSSRRAPLFTSNARPNPNIDTSDPYAKLLNKLPSSPPPEVVSTPPPVQVPEPIITTIEPESTTSTVSSVADQVNQIVDQVNQAASTAVEASNEVNQVVAIPSAAVIKTSVAAKVTAAKAVSTKSAAATTAATAASTIQDATSDSFEKVPSLVDYVTHGGAGGATSLTPNFAHTGENIVRLFHNIFGSGVVSKVSQVSDSSIKAISTNAPIILDSTSSTVTTSAKGAASVVAAAVTAENINSLVDNLKIDEFGGWYVAGATVLYAIKAKDDGVKEATLKFEQQLSYAQGKAEDAAQAADVAKEGAKQVKELVDGIKRNESKDVASAMVVEAKARELETDRDILRIRIEDLKHENAQKQILIDKLILRLHDETFDDAIEHTIEIPIVKETFVPDPEDDVKLLEIIKSIDDENAKQKKKVKKKAPKKEGVKASMVPNAKKTLTKKKKAPKAAKTVVAIKEPVEVETEDDFKEIRAAEDFFMDAISEVAAANVDAIKEIDAKNEQEKKNNPKGKRTKRPRRKTRAKVEKVVADDGSDTNPWGVLKPSTLQRKTIAQLSAYLKEREVDITGLSKKELVGTIQSL
mmetsp:Transcript_25816/g.29974  ORF Transcript_25816/g.29974 Transcript_25816/m.29974 type:complete len:607 (+) Transcript_25816:476-2296(+)